MTIRKGGPRAPRAAQENDDARRVRRPKPGRDGAIRSASGSARAEASDDAAAKPDGASDGTMSESVAHAVKTGYEVIADNIRQGREAAEKFRQGDYNIRDVPSDLEQVLTRLVHLARELSTTTFDVCERLLKEMGPSRDSEERRAAPVPPFRSSAGPKPAAPPPAAAAPPATDAGRMKLTVRFAGGGKAVSRTEMLDRPRRPTTAEELEATPLATRGSGPAITGVTFQIDVSVEGLVAVVPIPEGLAAGVYSGLVRARNDDVPLGVLSIEIPE